MKGSVIQDKELVWGNISGTLSNQTDLNNAINNTVTGKENLPLNIYSSLFDETPAGSYYRISEANKSTVNQDLYKLYKVDSPTIETEVTDSSTIPDYFLLVIENIDIFHNENIQGASVIGIYVGSDMYAIQYPCNGMGIYKKTVVPDGPKIFAAIRTISVSHENKRYTKFISSAEWSGSSAPYTKTITISGVNMSDTPIIDVILDGYTFQEQNDILEEWSKIYRISTGVNNITLYATEPTTINIPITILVVR